MLCTAASMMVACNSKTDSELDTKKDVIVQDTSSMYKSNGSTDVGTNQSPNPAPAVTTAPPVAAPVTQTKTIVRERTVYVDRTPRAQTNVQHSTNSGTVNTVPAQTTTTTTNTTSGTGTTTTTGSGTTTTTTAPATQQNKGWSNAAKDATIGGVGGAVGGAIISKNKGKGAVIGGIIGAAGGYILGRKKDKKDTIK